MRLGKLSITLTFFACLLVPALSQSNNPCADTKDYYKAVAACSDLIRAHPKDAALYHMRGLVLARNGDTGQAIRDYSKAIELNATYVPAYNSRALAYSNLGDYTRAVADATAASELEAKKGQPMKAAPQAARRERQATARPAAQIKRRGSSVASAKKTDQPAPLSFSPFEGM